MIIPIFLVLGTIIGLLLYIVYSFRGLLIAILLVILIFMFIKIVREAKEYGVSSLLKPFKKQDCTTEDLDLVEFIIKRNKGMRVMFRLENKIFVCISESGIYLIKVLDYTGKISGEESDEVLILQNDFLSSISNFFTELKEIEIIVKEGISDLIIKKIIIKKETTVILTPYAREYQVLGFRNLYYIFKILDRKKIYTIEQVKELSSKIQKNLSNTVKFAENSCQE